MNNVNEFRAALNVARQSQTVIDGVTFTVQLPLPHEWRKSIEQHRDEHHSVKQAEAFRALLDRALVGWSGLTTKHLLPTVEKAESVDYGDEFKQILLDVRQDIADELSIHLALQNKAFQERYEAEEKNS